MPTYSLFKDVYIKARLCGTKKCGAQVSYHGFGIIVKPEKMVEGHGRPLQEAVQRVLADPSFKVSNVVPLLS